MRHLLPLISSFNPPKSGGFFIFKKRNHYRKNHSYNKQYLFLQQNLEKRLISLNSFLQLKNPFLQHFLQQSLDLLCHTKDIPDHANSVCNCFICLSDLLYHPVTLIKNGEGEILSDTKWTVVKQHDAR